MFRLPNPSAPQSPAASRARFQSRAPPVRLGRRSSAAATTDGEETSLVEMENDDEREFDAVYREDAAGPRNGGGGSRHDTRARQGRRRSHLEHRHVTVSTLVHSAADDRARRRYVEFAVAEPRRERKHAVHSAPMTAPPPFATLVDRPVVYRLARVRHHSYNRTVSFRLVRVTSSSSSSSAPHRTVAGARLVSSDFLRQNAAAPVAVATDRSKNLAAAMYVTGPTRLAVAAGSLAELDGRVAVDERETEDEEDDDEEWIETSSSSSSSSSPAPPITDLAFAHVRPASTVRVRDGDGVHGRVALGAVLSGVEWEHEPADPRDTFYLDLLPPTPSATAAIAHQPRHHRHQQQRQHFVSIPQAHPTHQPPGHGHCYATAPTAVETFGATEFAVAFPASSSPPPPPPAVSVPYPAPPYPSAAFFTRPLVVAPSSVPAAANGGCHKPVDTDRDRRRHATAAAAPAPKSCVGASDNGGADDTVTTGGRERKRDNSRERDLVRRWRKAGRPDPDALAFTTTRRQMEYAAVAFLVGFVACIALGLLRRRSSSSSSSSRARCRKSRDRSESPANRN